MRTAKIFMLGAALAASGCSTGKQLVERCRQEVGMKAEASDEERNAASYRLEACFSQRAAAEAQDREEFAMALLAGTAAGMASARYSSYRAAPVTYARGSYRGSR